MRRRTDPGVTSHFLSSVVITQPGVKLLLRAQAYCQYREYTREQSRGSSEDYHIIVCEADL